jgi:TatD DNase family protein
MFIDTHTHLYASEFDADREALIKKAQANGVGRFYMPNIDSGSIEAMLLVENRYGGACRPMMGLHPCSVNENVGRELSIVKDWLEKRRFAAIGEIGIDLHWDKTFIEQQRHAFSTQVAWAVEYNYPVVIHTRESFDVVIELLEAAPKLPKGIFHCFSGNAQQAERIIALGGFKLGIGGVITFKNSGLDKVLADIDLEHLVLETDAPYLAPVPFRGKRNEPVYLLEVAKKLAEVKNVPLSEVSRRTTMNAEYIFENS